MYLVTGSGSVKAVTWLESGRLMSAWLMSASAESVSEKLSLHKLRAFRPCFLQAEEAFTYFDASKDGFMDRVRHRFEGIKSALHCTFAMTPVAVVTSSSVLWCGRCLLALLTAVAVWYSHELRRLLVCPAHQLCSTAATCSDCPASRCACATSVLQDAPSCSIARGLPLTLPFHRCLSLPEQQRHGGSARYALRPLLHLHVPAWLDRRAHGCQSLGCWWTPQVGRVCH